MILFDLITLLFVRLPEPGCADLEPRPNGLIINDDSLSAWLLCSPTSIVAGNQRTFCDGQQWDRKLGECRPENEDTKRCDFESESICGWSTDQLSEFPWIRKNGWNSFEKVESGPKHDHTVYGC